MSCECSSPRCTCDCIACACHRDHVTPQGEYLPARDEENRRLAEWLFGVPLDGFGIYSAGGARLRDRDFDSAEEAQRYIDAEDERLTESHKSTAKGVHIRPCVKAHPDFFSDEAANALLLEKMLGKLEAAVHMMWRNGHFQLALFLPSRPTLSGRDGGSDYVAKDRKAAIVKAALAELEAQK